MLRAETPVASASMTQDQVEDFFKQQKKGTPVQLELDKGKEVKGLFASYDDYYEMVWLVPKENQHSLLSQKGYKLSGIHAVKLWDAAQATNTSSDKNSEEGFILMKKDNPEQ